MFPRTLLKEDTSIVHYEVSPHIDIKWRPLDLHSVSQPYTIPTHLALYLESGAEILKVFETC